MLKNFSPVSQSAIKSIEFYVKGTDEIKDESNITVTSNELYSGSIPYPGGLHDLHMGTQDNNYICSTCLNNKEKCPGHDGEYELNYPVKNPLYVSEIFRWVKVICLDCGRILIDKKTYIKIKKKERLSRIIQNIRNRPEKKCKCQHCDAQCYKIEKSPTNTLIFYKIKDSGKNTAKDAEKIPLNNHEIMEIFQKIHSEDLEFLGFNEKTHPKKFILTSIKIPTNTIRPDIKSLRGGNKINSNDLTTLLRAIIAQNEEIPKVEFSQIAEKYQDTIEALDQTIFAFIKGGTSTTNKVKVVMKNNEPCVSVGGRLKSKKGRIRGNILGKASNSTGRTVISCGLQRPDYVGLPIHIARIIQIPEKVTEFNKDRLMVYFLNKKDFYPGCSEVIKSDGRRYKTANLKEYFTIEVGDTIMRDIIDGDEIPINRQPTLLSTGITSLKAKINPYSNTLMLNVSNCNWFNADFDGDEMNIFAALAARVRFEMMMLAGPSRWIKSYQDGKTTIGAYQDTLAGLTDMTSNRIEIDRLTTMMLLGFDYDKKIPMFTKNYSGRDLISLIMPKINFSKNATFYNPMFAPFLKYNKDEIKVVIEDGKLISGILDKGTIGQKGTNNIIQLIYDKYGAQKVLDFLYYLQRMVNQFNNYNGFTASFGDIIIPKKALKEVYEKETALLYEADLVTQDLKNGNLIPPIGVSVSDFYEQKIVAALNPGSDFIEPVISSINPEENGIYKLIFSGSKGSKSNMINMSVAVGLVLVGGKFIKLNFGSGRAVPFCPKYSKNPIYRGYVPDSLVSGLSPISVLYSAQEARHQFTKIALSICITGENMRKGTKNLESLIINNLFCVSKQNTIIQLLYGESGFDPRKLIKTNIPHILISDKDMEKFKANKKDFDNKYQKKELDMIIEDEYEQLLKDREMFRRVGFRIEKTSYKRVLFSNSVLMPFNFRQLFENIKKEKTPKINPFECYEMVKTMCEEIPYVLYNQFVKDMKMPIPKYVDKSFTMMRIYIRSHLCLSNLINNKISTENLKNLINLIEFHCKDNLMPYGSSVGNLAAQAIGEPASQKALDTKHQVGMSEIEDTDSIIRYDEIQSFKSKNEMQNPKMILFTSDRNAKLEEIQKIANHIEMIKFSRFIKRFHVFFEKYGSIIHPDFIHEEKMFKQFEKHNVGVKQPKNLINYCIRFELDNIQLIMKSMELETIIMRLNEVYPKMYVIYTPEDSDQIIIRCYMEPGILKSKTAITPQMIYSLADELSEMIIRGVSGIVSTDITQVPRSYVNEDGSISNKKEHCIITKGVNLEEILLNPYIDPDLIYTDSIKDVEQVFGIEAARNRYMNELNLLIPDAIYPHYTLYADELTYLGYGSKIGHSGLSEREDNNILLQMTSKGPIQVITKASLKNKKDHVKGISSKLMAGTVPHIGSLYNSFVVNEEFIKKNTISVEQQLDML